MSRKYPFEKTYRNPVRPGTITLAIRPGRGRACVAEGSHPQLASYLFSMRNVRLVVVILPKNNRLISTEVWKRISIAPHPVSGGERQLQVVEGGNNLVDELGRIFPECVYPTASVSHASTFTQRQNLLSPVMRSPLRTLEGRPYQTQLQQRLSKG